MDIRVGSVTGRTYPLSVSGEVSASTLAQEISFLTGTPSNQLQLFSSGLLREDTSLHISTGDEVQFLTKVRSGTSIYVKTYNKTITLEVDLQFDTVEYVKCRIEERIGIGKDEMILVFENTELKNAEKLCTYNILFESTLHLVNSRKDMKRQTSQAAGGDGNPSTSKCCCVII